jgi:hypothetical protein
MVGFLLQLTLKQLKFLLNPLQKNMPNSEKKINSYRLQYWLYAVLNKEFGKEVKFTRDSLHSRYIVNRHGFDISTNTLSIEKVQEFLVKKLQDCQFTSTKGFGDSTDLVKTNQYQNTKEELYICINKQIKFSYINNKPVLSVSPRQYLSNKY